MRKLSLWMNFIGFALLITAVFNFFEGKPLNIQFIVAGLVSLVIGILAARRSKP